MNIIDYTYWNVPRFIKDEPSEREAGTCSQSRSFTKVDTLQELRSWQPVNRTYEDGQWYYVVFKPYNKPYEKDPDWYWNYAVDKAKRWGFRNSKTFIVTRERDAAKVHANVLIHSHQDLLRYQDKSVYNKYRLHVSLLEGKADRLNVLNYITKEAKVYSFKLYQDYYYTK